MATRSDQNVRTSDLTLATYLEMKGHESQLLQDGVRAGKPVAVWEFGEDAAEHVAEFDGDRACVEPKRFHSALTATRRSLFRFLDAR